MKAKIKVKLEEISSMFGAFKELYLYIKYENEFFYTRRSFISNTKNGKLRVTDEEFYNEVLYIISDINNIKKVGEDMVRRKIQQDIDNKKLQGKEKEVKELLKKLKQPIEIEVKM